MDLVVLIIIICIIVFWKKTFASFVYFLSLTDIILRVLTFIRMNIGLPDVSESIAKYVPSSVKSVIDVYSSGILNNVLTWGHVLIYILFIFYVAKYFIKMK